MFNVDRWHEIEPVRNAFEMGLGGDLSKEIDQKNPSKQIQNQSNEDWRQLIGPFHVNTGNPYRDRDKDLDRHADHRSTDVG